MEEQEYQVSWEIDISAESPEQAALLAIDYLAPDGTGQMVLPSDRQGRPAKPSAWKAKTCMKLWR